MEPEIENFTLKLSKVDISNFSKNLEQTYYEKIIVTDNFVAIKEKDLKIFKKKDSALIEIHPSIESKEILQFFSLPKNIIYYLEPSELKKLDLNNLKNPPRKIIFMDKSSIIKPNLIHIEQITISNHESVEDFTCIFMKSETNQLYIDISPISEGSNKENEDIEINPIFLKNFEDFENVQNLHFTTFKDNHKEILGLFILCSKIGYYYRIDIKKFRENLEKKFYDNKYKVIYKIEESYLHFFSAFELDIYDKKPIRLLLGNETFVFDLINLQHIYQKANNLGNKKSEETLQIIGKDKEKNELNKIEEVTENIEEEIPYIDTENAVKSLTQKTTENNENSIYDDEAYNTYFNNNEYDDNDNDNDNDNFNGNEINLQNENQKIYLQEYVSSYISKNNIKIGKSKLKADDFKTCFIKKENIFFFFKNWIYLFDLKTNVISSSFSAGLTENITDVFFWLEEELGEKYFQKSYILFNRNLHIFQYQISNYILLNSTRMENNNNKGNAENIRSMIREQKLCEWCYKQSKQRCSVCKLAHYCCREHQLLDWARHKEFCVNKDHIVSLSILTFDLKKEISDKRLQIFDFYNSGNFKIIQKGLDYNNELIEMTLKILNKNSENFKKFQNENIKTKSELLNFMELNKIYLEHCSNILLLGYGKRKKEAFMALHLHQKGIMEDPSYKEFFRIIPSFYRHLLVEEGEIELSLNSNEERMKFFKLDKTDISLLIKKEFFKIVENTQENFTTFGKLYYFLG